MTALFVISALLFVFAALACAYTVLRDRAAEAEWAVIDAAWHASGPDTITALRLDIYRRSAPSATVRPAGPRDPQVYPRAARPL